MVTLESVASLETLKSATLYVGWQYSPCNTCAMVDSMDCLVHLHVYRLAFIGTLLTASQDAMEVIKSTAFK